MDLSRRYFIQIFGDELAFRGAGGGRFALAARRSYRAYC